jgi:GNAT superfamily N-acetyltransferase
MPADPGPISPARPADVAGVVELIGRVFAEYGWIYDPPGEVADLFRFDAHYTPPRGAFFVVHREGAVVGSVGVERLAAHTAELHRLYLAADLRGRGLGRALVETILDWCRSHGITRLVLWSDTRFEQAHRLYTRLGFRQQGERELPGDPNQTREYRFERQV